MGFILSILFTCDGQIRRFRFRYVDILPYSSVQKGRSYYGPVWYADIKTMTDASIIRVRIDTSEWGHDPVHSMIGIRVNFTTVVGRIQGMEPPYKPRKRVVMAGKKKNKGQYMKIAEERQATHKTKGTGIAAWAGELEKINKGMRTADGIAKKKIQQKNDVLIKKIVRELLAIEEEQNQTQNKYGGAQQRHCWSDVFSRRNAIHRLLVDIVKKVIKHDSGQ